jgi:hypothetical protein
MLFEPEYDTRPCIHTDRFGCDPDNRACVLGHVYAGSNGTHKAHAAYRGCNWYIGQRRPFYCGHNLAMVVVWAA